MDFIYLLTYFIPSSSESILVREYQMNYFQVNNFNKDRTFQVSTTMEKINYKKPLKVPKSKSPRFKTAHIWNIQVANKCRVVSLV